MEFIKVILSLENPFDYEEYKIAMKKKGLHVATIGNFAQVVGMLKVAIYQHPDMEPEQAYMAFLTEMNTPKAVLKGQDQPAGEGCCGGKKEDRPLPPLTEEAKNLLAATTKHLMLGLKKIDEKTLAIRNDICDKCDSMRSDGRCAECGCYMRIKGKWAEAKCKLEKW